MSMNILIETRVAPEVTFIKENPSLMAGEVAINEEGTGIKIGDGVNNWSDLEYIPHSTELINKWLTIANSTTNSKLITLPDLNFAYSVVTAESNPMVEDVVKNVIGTNNYIELNEVGVTETSENGILNLKGSEVLEFLSSTIPAARYENISRLAFVNRDGEDSREFLLWDEGARELIENLNTTVTDLNNRVKGVEDFAGEAGEALSDKLNPFVPGGTSPGLVNTPTINQSQNGGYFLNADGTWKKVGLKGNEIPLSASNATTVTDAITALQNGASLKFQKDTTTSKAYVIGYNGSDSTLRYSSSVYVDCVNNVLLGAAYNDYAEARETGHRIQPGRVVVENGDDTLSMANGRLLLGGNIVSDTYGMLIGETDKAKTPIALCGRVLAYPHEDIEEFYPGAPVCTGPGGTVSVMTKNEVLRYPECIIGYVSAIPTYEEWNGVNVNNRIWIKVI